MVTADAHEGRARGPAKSAITGRTPLYLDVDRAAAYLEKGTRAILPAGRAATELRRETKNAGLAELADSPGASWRTARQPIRGYGAEDRDVLIILLGFSPAR